jgi:hypothetical protein
VAYTLLASFSLPTLLYGRPQPPRSPLPFTILRERLLFGGKRWKCFGAYDTYTLWCLRCFADVISRNGRRSRYGDSKLILDTDALVYCCQYSGPWSSRH